MSTAQYFVHVRVEQVEVEDNFDVNTTDTITEDEFGFNTKEEALAFFANIHT